MISFQPTVPPIVKDDSTTIRVRVGVDVTYQSVYPTPLLLIVRPKDGPYHRLIEERRVLEPVVPVDEYVDSFGNHVWRLLTPPGALRIMHDVLAETPAAADPAFPGMLRTPIDALPDTAIMYTLPSRYCESDKLIGDAWRMFGHIETGWEQVQAVCDWLHANITYAKGSNSQTSAYDVYKEGRGVCRDFAHLAVTFCRALNIPARYVCGYLPEIGVEPDPTPMDFHAWFEAFLDGEWRVFDARHNRPRIGRVLIATGRDAVDVAWATAFGGAQLTRMRVWADQVDTHISLDSVRE